jgi:serine/threonine-protein kinase
VYTGFVSLQPGKQIGGKLLLQRMLGRGAMGSVWVADHLGLGTQCAVKFMAPGLCEDEVSVQRFKREAHAAAEIRSPHVVQMFDHGATDDGLLYIVMELLEGESLDKRIRRVGPLGLHEAANIVCQAAKALAKAHERGIIHRDIKPANLFLCDDGSGAPFVKVLDFGVAKFASVEGMQMTAAGQMVGTPAFMSPEQLFHGREVDHRGDLWSLGVVAYYAFTGTRPFEGATLGELCVAIKRGEFVLPGRLRPDVPPDVDAWFVRAFHGDIQARFWSARMLAEELERVIGLPSVMQSTPSAVATTPGLATFGGTSLSSHPAGAPRRRWPIIAAAAVAGAALSIGAAAFFMSRGDTPAAPAAGPAAAATAAPAPAEPTVSTTPDTEPPPAASATASADAAASGAPTLTVPPVSVPRPAAPPQPVDGEDERKKRAAEKLGI